MHATLDTYIEDTWLGSHRITHQLHQPSLHLIAYDRKTVFYLHGLKELQTNDIRMTRNIFQIFCFTYSIHTCTLQMLLPLFFLDLKKNLLNLLARLTSFSSIEDSSSSFSSTTFKAISLLALVSSSCDFLFILQVKRLPMSLSIPILLKSLDYLIIATIIVHESDRDLKIFLTSSMVSNLFPSPLRLLARFENHLYISMMFSPSFISNSSQSRNRSSILDFFTWLVPSYVV